MGVSKAADEMAARAARAMARGRQEQQQEDTPAPEAPAPRKRPAAPVKAATTRMTVDLLPVVRRDLGRWCSEAAEQLGEVQVPAAAVVRALIAELLDDDQLSEAVRQRLRDDLAP